MENKLRSTKSFGSIQEIGTVSHLTLGTYGPYHEYMRPTGYHNPPPNMPRPRPTNDGCTIL